METTILTGISAFLLALTVLYAAREVKLLRVQHQDNHDWNRRLAAQQAVREYKEIQFMVEALSVHFDYHHRKEGIPTLDFEAKLKEIAGLQSNLHTVLNYFEGLARGIRQGIYDEELIRVAFRGHMLRVYESFRYYIEGNRQKLGNPKIWVELEDLVDAWRKEARGEIIDQKRSIIAVKKQKKKIT